jgi:guanosine-3',5'-bis(diphosphate) 3'-pyrophosphohydrolase
MTPLVNEALVYATMMHARANQTRRFTNAPYIVHPIAVMMTLKRYGYGEPATLAAALLHDVVEDTPATLKGIETAFGSLVAELVYHVTNQPGDTEDMKNARLAKAPEAAQAIKLADIVDNCAGLAAIDPEYARVYLPKKRATVLICNKPGLTLCVDARHATIVTA